MNKSLAINVPRQRSGPRRGFSLLEVVISTFLVGLVVVASMRTLGATVRATQLTNDRGRAVLLADALISEIQRTNYKDSVNSVFGRESDETASYRSQHDDVDDYDNWSASPPELSDGTTIDGLVGWQRSVTIDHLDSDDLATVLSDSVDAQVKRIRVTVQRNGQVLAELTAIVTSIQIEGGSSFNDQPSSTDTPTSGKQSAPDNLSEL